MSRGFATIMTDNRRIAQNTLIVYVRLILTTAVGLLVSRLFLGMKILDYALNMISKYIHGFDYGYENEVE